jgi:hypothetical protein
MKTPVTNWIIVGTQNNNKAFRPSDWAGRISELGSLLQDNKIVQYCEELRPIRYNGDSAVYVDASLKANRVEIWEQVMGFARFHQLKIIEQTAPVAAFFGLHDQKAASNSKHELQDAIETAQLAA